MSEPAGLRGQLVPLGELCSALGADLEMVVAPRAREHRLVAAVHISDLPDPTPYLAGGELLLTTGMSLSVDSRGIREYLGKLQLAEVSALGVGLGPVLQKVPSALSDACASMGLPLLVVPAATPFQVVVTNYWRISTRPQMQLATGHRRLLEALSSDDPDEAILAALASCIGGWAALCAPDGGALRVYPPAALAEVRRAHTELTLARTTFDARAAASFSSHERFVAVFPLEVAGGLAGRLVVGTTHGLSANERRVIQSAVTLLTARIYLREGNDSSLASLVDLGEVPAARRLAVQLGRQLPLDGVRVIAIRSASATLIAELLHQRHPDILRGPPRDDTAWVIAPPLTPELAIIAGIARACDPMVRVYISGEVSLDSVSAARVQTDAAAELLRDGEVRADAPPRARAASARRGVDALVAYGGSLVADVVAYLRQRGNSEQAARAVGVARSTLRYRLERAQQVMQLDLSDPDTAAEVWLELRGRNLA